MCALDYDDKITHTLPLREAGTCATRSHLCANTHSSLLLHHSLVLAFVYFCSLMEGQQNVQLPPDTTE